MKKAFLILLLFLSTQQVKAQLFDGDTLSLSVPGAEPRLKISPLYPGGTKIFLQDLHAEIYTQLKGKIKDAYVSLDFSINTEGFITYSRIVKSGGKKMDSAVQKALQKSKQFVPTSLNGNPIETIYSLTFHITKTFANIA